MAVPAEPAGPVGGPGAESVAGLSLEGVSAGYRHGRRTRHVVGDVSASARAGTVTALLGPNGAGKSTLLRSIAGLQPLLGGSVRLIDADGRHHDLLALSPRERARRTAVVLTDRIEAGLLTGREVVELGRHPYRGLVGRLTDNDRRLISRVLADLQATELAAQRFTELSDGQRQRLLLARALVTEPDLVVLDEPSAFLDVGARVDLMALLGRIARERMVTVLLSTHEVELALRMADHLWVIRDHRIVAGTPEALVADGLIGQVFGTDHAHFDPGTRTFQVRGAGAAR